MSCYCLLYSCSTDEHLISTPEYEGDLDAHISGVAARFAESATVKYRCSVAICEKATGECDAILVHLR